MRAIAGLQNEDSGDWLNGKPSDWQEDQDDQQDDKEEEEQEEDATELGNA